MMTKDAVVLLIPDTDDVYTIILREFFMVLLSLTPDAFMGIDSDCAQEDMTVILSEDLRQIWQSYQGTIRHPDYHVRAFLASLYQLETLDTKSPNQEWCWISKICHLLVYFAKENHQSRIKETCPKCRLWLNRKSIHHKLWQDCQTLQADTLQETHKNFTQYREQKLSSKLELNEFQSIYRSVDFAYRERHPITRKSSSGHRLRKPKTYDRQEIHRCDDGDDSSDELLEVTAFYEDNDNVDFNSARLDIGLPDFTIMRQTSLRETDKYSAQQIIKRTQAKYNHANRQEMFISTSLRHLATPVIQKIASLLWRIFEYSKHQDEKIACAYLLLSLYTGRSVQMLVDDAMGLCGKILKLSPKKSCYELIVCLDITPLRIQETNIKQVIANQSCQMCLPLPRPLGDFISGNAAPNDEYIKQVMSIIQKELKLPLLSLARLEKSLYTLLLHDICTGQIASILTGRNQHKRADIWYSTHSKQEIADCYQKAIKLLSARHAVSMDYLEGFAFKLDSIGSQNCPDYPLIRNLMQHLYQQVMTTTNPIAQFNAYNLWLWHVCLLLTSVRAVNGAPGFLNQFNLDVGLAWISDKESRETTSSQRFVPVCEFLIVAITRFVAYLTYFAKRFGRLYPTILQGVDEIIHSKRPLLSHIDDNHHLQVLNPADVRQKIQHTFRFKLDWTRHVGQRFLHEREVSEAVVLAIFGHEMMGQESWQIHSSFSVGDILNAKTHYDELAKHLQLTQIDEMI